MMGDRQWPAAIGWDGRTTEFGAGRGSDTKGAAARNSRPTSPRRILPLCGPEELHEELAEIQTELERLAGLLPMNEDADQRSQEREATLNYWRDRLLEQLAADENP